MKKYINIMLVALIISGILFSCTKSSDPAASKDYTISIKDKTWWGTLTYTGQNAEYYSVHFNADNTLVWSQLSGDYTGHWAITGKQVTMTFDANTAQVNADITDDNKLMNITDNTSYYEINSGELIANPNLSSLDNTLWKGSYTFYAAGSGSGSTKTIEMSFIPGLKVQWKLGGGLLGPFDYTRSASGVAVRTGNNFFGIATSGTEMKGTDGGPHNLWEATKQ